jgi:molybdopterin-containing oxidoreductase family membrane subunit
MKHGEVVNVSQRQGRESIWHVPRNTGEPNAIGTDIPESQFEVLGGNHTYETLTDRIAGVVLTNKISVGWALGLLAALSLLGLLGGCILWLILNGVGVWGVNIPVGWGWDIINFVWWIGIGHAGTLISAVFLLVHQGWRTSINRFAEAMTLFAVACAGMYPLLHVGRHQYAYWMLPLPNSMGLWPQFKSPLLWDVFAVSTYATVSLLFWYVGLVPDLAVLRDRAKSRAAKVAYGTAALGWRNSGRHWHRYNAIYLLLAAFSTPLVLSVHSVVSFDFAVGVVPGWHTTIFPPYFVAGAVYAGFAMVLILAIPLRRWCGLEDFITMRHLENSAKVMLATSLIVFYGYIMEVFFGWYSANEYEGYLLINRFTGPYAWSYWALIFCNGLAPQILWWRKMRTNLPVLFIVSIIVSIGMWLERFVIIVLSLHRDFLPSSWGYYRSSWVDWGIYIGSFGLFFTLFLLFVRFLPAIAIAEMRELLHHKLMHGHHGHDDAHDDKKAIQGASH